MSFQFPTQTVTTGGHRPTEPKHEPDNQRASLHFLDDGQYHPMSLGRGLRDHTKSEREGFIPESMNEIQRVGFRA
jgi:hypothetical protein